MVTNYLQRLFADVEIDCVHSLQYRLLNAPVKAAIMCIQGAPKNPLGKINYLSYCNSFFTKYTAFTEEDSGHIHSKFYYDTWYC